MAQNNNIALHFILFKFRKRWLSEEGLMDKIIGKNLKIAVDNGLIK